MRKIKIGAELVALRDVSLLQGKLDKGTHVKVLRISRKFGEPVAVDLELKDGQVLRDVSSSKMLDNFTQVRSK